jgi:transcription elongation factor Elf1
MYQYRKNVNKKENKPPFEIRCTNCGSHNVTITAFEYRDLEIRCRSCGQSADDIGVYNEMNYLNGNKY